MKLIYFFLLIQFLGSCLAFASDQSNNNPRFNIAIDPQTGSPQVLKNQDFSVSPLVRKSGLVLQKEDREILFAKIPGLNPKISSRSGSKTNKATFRFMSKVFQFKGWSAKPIYPTL